MSDHDPVNHPTHYMSDATCDNCGESIECIQVARHHSFTRGNALKYLWRAGAKGDTVEDLRKAIWYIQDEIAMLENRPNPNVHRLSERKFTDEELVQNGMTPNMLRANPALGLTIDLRNFEGAHNVDAEMTRTEERADDDTKPCNIADDHFWSSKGYTYQCRTHDRSVTVPVSVTPHRCYE